VEYTYEVDGDDLAVQIKPHTRESDAGTKTLRLIAKPRLL
jgi:hypothetical protein